jgi:hypothetical protein
LQGGEQVDLHHPPTLSPLSPGFRQRFQTPI